MRKRLWIAYSIVSVLFIGLIGRLWVICFTKPAAVASSQSSRTISVATTRGTIYDRNCNPLVNDTKEYRAAVSPRESLLAIVRNATTNERFTALREQLVKGNPTSVRLTKEITTQDGLQLFYVPVRYGERLLAPHIIGYLDNSAQYGVCGIEYGYNEMLASYNGKLSVSFATDGIGRYLAGVAPKITNTLERSYGGLVLTLDKKIQMIVEDTGSRLMQKGAIVVSEPQSGDVLAMASFPSFQPATVNDSIQNNDGALLNRVLSLYDCGSVFKIITTAAALENDISQETSFSCDGYMDINGTRFHCHNRRGHGVLSMKEAFAQSCNLYYIQLAKQIGAIALIQTACDFGMDRELEIASSVKAPASLLPATETLVNSDAALANLSFGQGYLLSTPLHFAAIISTLLNDGLRSNLSLVAGTVDEEGAYVPLQQERGERVVSSRTASALRVMMQSAVVDGTGAAAAVDTLVVGGKTGTAETGQINQDGARVVQSWFAGYIIQDNQTYVITVLCEDAEQTNAKSTVVFHDIASEMLSLL